MPRRSVLAAFAAMLLALAGGCEPRRPDPKRPDDPARPPQPKTS